MLSTSSTILAQLNKMALQELCGYCEVVVHMAGSCQNLQWEACLWGVLCLVLWVWKWSIPLPPFLVPNILRACFKVPTCPWPTFFLLRKAFRFSVLLGCLILSYKCQKDCIHLLFSGCFWEPWLLWCEMTSWEHFCFFCLSTETDFLILCCAVWLVKKCSIISTTISSSSFGIDPKA